MSKERLILAALAQNQEFAKKVVGYIQPEYFGSEAERNTFDAVKHYILTYHGLPVKLATSTIIESDEKLDERRVEEAVAVVEDIYDIVPPADLAFLVKSCEDWCKDRALYLAINRSINIYQGEDGEKTLTPAAIPDIVKAALSVSFDTSLGLDFYEDTEKRWTYYTTPENRIPFKLEVLNEVTGGGVTKKTLNIIAAGVNVGKTLALVALTSDYLRLGLNVLYITQEMREEAIMQRVDANLLDVAINNVVNLGKERFMGAVEKIRAKSFGRLKVKEYPPSSANALHFERLVEEYAMQHNFVPDVIMVDYIQITASYKMTAGTGSYYYYKSVAEELRALAVKRDLVMWTVSQFNRGGMDNTNPSMSDIGESTGIPATADAMWAIMRTDELDQIGQLSWKQLKSRYADKSAKTHFMTGVDVERQQFLNIQESRETVVRRTTDVGQSPKDRFAKMKFQGAQQ